MKPFFTLQDPAFLGGQGYDTEVLAWETALTGSGLTLSQTTKDAANVFMKAIKTANIRSKILRMNLYAGGGSVTNLRPWLVPIIHDIGTATDHIINALNLGLWNYTETGSGGGLNIGSSGGDVVAAGDVLANDASMGLNNIHIGVYLATKANGIKMGAGQSGVGVVYIYNFSSTSYFSAWEATGASDCSFSDSVQTGHFITTRNGTTYGYRNGAQVAINASPTGAACAQAILVHGASLNGGIWAGAGTSATICGYHLGTYLSAAEVSALYTAWQAFQTALGRNV